MRVLLVQDDDSIALQIVSVMPLMGHEIDWASSAYEAELSLQSQSHDLVLLDFGCACLNSFDLLRRYRKREAQAAVVALIPQGLFASPMVVLDSGADDYLMKPFELEDLRARVRLSMRRPYRLQGRVALGNLSVNSLDHSVLLDGLPVSLRPSEYRILIALVNEPTRVFTRSELALHLDGQPRAALDNNAVDVVVHGLRRKLGAEKVVTVRGVGYRLCQSA